MPSWRRTDGHDDDDLLRSARAGEVAAVDEILRRHHSMVHAVCARIVVDSGGAEDATQEAMLAVARGLRRFDGRSSLGTWIYRVATNAALDEVRRVGRRPRPTVVATDGDSRVTPGPEEAIAISDELSRALQTLDPEIRATMALRHVVGLDYAEIARTLGVPIGTVRSRLSRGREALRGLLGEHAPGGGNSGTPSERQTDDADGRHSEQ